VRSRKLAAGFTALALIGGLAACGSSKKAASTASGFTPVTKDTLTVVTSLPAPGFFEGDDPAKITGGLEYSMAQELAKRLGLKNVKVINTSFDSIVAGAVTDKFDIVFSQVTITDERKKAVTFSTPYFDADQGILAKTGTKVASLADAQKLKWGVQSSTTGEALVNDKIKPSAQAQSFADLTAAYTALDAGQVDAVMMDTTINQSQAAKSGGKEAVVGQFKTGEQYGAIYPKGDAQANIDALNKLLATLVSDGTVKTLTAKWLGADPSSVPVIPLG
jgi:polar amino acid transport system substrate-binding protein